MGSDHAEANFDNEGYTMNLESYSRINTFHGGLGAYPQ